MTFRQDIQVFWGIRIALSDGIQLVADVYRPVGEQVVPAIVVRTPYGRSSKGHVDSGRYFANQGYAYVVVDVRGRGDSEGIFIPYRNEGRDGYDVIEWVAGQPWCTGAVGTLGGSYLGRVQWLAALEKPPHLKAMVPIVTPSDPFVETPTGVPSPMHLCWLFLTADRAVQNMDAVDWERVYWHLPLVTMDEQTGRNLPAWREEFLHPFLDEWWKAICYQTRFNEIDIPALHISGWYDDEQIGTPKNYIGMSQHAPSAKARAAQRLIMGPWPHDVNSSTKMGEVDFGPKALIDLRGEQVRFFDFWLKGLDNGLEKEPPVSIFVMGENTWRQDAAFPPEGMKYQRWYFHSNGRANSLFGDGRLSTMIPSPDMSEDRYRYDPENPVPFITEPTSSQIGGPDDYTPIHRRDDVLVYTSEPLTEPLEVTGPVSVELYASTSVKDTDFMAQVHDVWPSGYAQRLCDGMVRVRFRGGMDKPELLEPGAVAKLVIDCWYTSHVFLPGHRIRVHVTSSAFPKYDRNPNTGDELGLSNRMVIANQTVYHNGIRPSAVVLPVVPRIE